MAGFRKREVSVDDYPGGRIEGAILGGMSDEQGRPLVGVGVVFVRRGRIFLARRQGSHGEATWASAGGHLEQGESLEDCARREAKEELGLEVGNLIFLCVSNIISYGKHYVDVEFLGDIGDQDPRPAEPDSFSEQGWFEIHQPPEPLFDPVNYALDSLKTGRYYYPGPEGLKGVGS